MKKQYVNPSTILESVECYVVLTPSSVRGGGPGMGTPGGKGPGDPG